MKEKKNQEYIEILAEESARKKLVVFVGAGVSMNSDLPSWNSLVAKYSERLKLEKKIWSSEETLIIPEIYYDKFGKIKYYEVLNEVFQGNFKPHKIHELIDKLSPNYVITTNYDTLLEDKLNNPSKYDLVVKEEDLAYSQSDKMIIKMHGDLQNKNVVLKKSDYDNYEKNRPLITTFIKSLFTTNTVLFIGYSLNDVNIKNILNWINEILKEDFRRVYLADLSPTNLLKEYENANNKIINRVFLKNSNLEDPNKNLGDILAEFLEEIVEAKKIAEENLKGKLYKKLNYLMDSQLKKILKISLSMGYEWFSDSPILNKKINQNKLETIIDMHDYLLKSNIIKIQGNPSEDSDRKKELENIFKGEYSKKAIEKTIVDSFMVFDYEEAEKVIFKNRINNIQLLSYIYFQKKDYEKAKELLKESSKNEKSNEIKIWNFAIINSIEIREKNKISSKTKKYYEIDLKNEYEALFDNNYTDLYKEIFENYTLNQVKDKMSNLYNKIKISKKTITIAGESPLVSAQILIRDFLSYCYFNGIIIENLSEIKSIFKDYIEIILISYTNEISEDELKEYSERRELVNKITQFEYLSFYVMLYLDSKDLKNLLNEYKIDLLKVEDDEINLFVKALKNFSNVEKIKSTHIFDRKSLENFFMIFGHLKLNPSQLSDVFKEIFNKEVLEKLQHNEIKTLIHLLNKNIKEISEDELGKILTALIKSRSGYFDMSIEFLIDTLTYHLKEKRVKEIISKEEIKKFCEDNFKDNIKIKLYFTRIVSESYKKEIIKEALSKLENDFNVTVYALMLRLELIEANSKYENKMIDNLNETFAEENKKMIFLNIHSYCELTSTIISLNLDAKTTQCFKDDLKKIENHVLNEALKKQNYYNLWNYSVDEKEADISKFTIEDFDLFTELGLEGFLLKNQGKGLEALIEKYLKSKYDDKILNAFLKVNKK